jgi:hypothetical protein
MVITTAVKSPVARKTRMTIGFADTELKGFTALGMLLLPFVLVVDAPDDVELGLDTMMDADVDNDAHPVGQRKRE